MSIAEYKAVWPDACTIAQSIRHGDLSPTDSIEHSIRRIEKLNPLLNAVIHPLFEKARDTAASDSLANGPFRGVPVLLKDLLAQSAGDPYHLGMAFLRRRAWVAPADSFVVRKLRRAGFVIVGRTNTSELAATATTEPMAYGATLNPWALDLSPGGSSGGSAAAVASGMVPVAHGNDMGGSIRIPAAACGLVGLKPSRGRISLGPEFGEYWGGLAHDGALTRSVRDTAAVLDVMSGAMPGDPNTAPSYVQSFESCIARPPRTLRCGMVTNLAEMDEGVHPDCVRAVVDTAHLLESLGHHVEDTGPRALLDAPSPSISMLGTYIARELDRWSSVTGASIGPNDVEPWTWHLAEQGRHVSAGEYLANVERRNLLVRKLCEWWASGYDLLITPTAAQPTPPIGTKPQQLMKAYGRFTLPWNLTGQPAISLPMAHTRNGSPIGVQLVADSGRDDLLLRVAAQLESIKGGFFQTAPSAIRPLLALE